jgi:hypothetical protein
MGANFDRIAKRRVSGRAGGYPDGAASEQW